MTRSHLSKLIGMLPPVRGLLTMNSAVGRQTWFGVGGPAEILFRPADAADLAVFLRALPPKIPIMVVGVGSNVLVRDGGIPGVVIRLGRGFAGIQIEHDEVRAGAAALDRIVAFAAVDAGIGGFEFLSGIPGSIGGSLRMNAGAYGGGIEDLLVSVTALGRSGKTLTIDRRGMGLSYRHSDVDPSWIFVEARRRSRKDRFPAYRNPSYARENTTSACPHRWIDIQESTRRQRMAVDRCRRLPRSRLRRCNGLGEAHQFPDQHRERNGGRSGRSR
jgi:UDP-N-acetylenolpyruvoylglucosamine reductase